MGGMGGIDEKRKASKRERGRDICRLDIVCEDDDGRATLCASKLPLSREKPTNGYPGSQVIPRFFPYMMIVICT